MNLKMLESKIIDCIKNQTFPPADVWRRYLTVSYGTSDKSEDERDRFPSHYGLTKGIWDAAVAQSPLIGSAAKVISTLLTHTMSDVISGGWSNTSDASEHIDIDKLPLSLYQPIWDKFCKEYKKDRVHSIVANISENYSEICHFAPVKFLLKYASQSIVDSSLTSPLSKMAAIRFARHFGNNPGYLLFAYNLERKICRGYLSGYYADSDKRKQYLSVSGILLDALIEHKEFFAKHSAKIVRVLEPEIHCHLVKRHPGLLPEKAKNTMAYAVFKKTNVDELVGKIIKERKNASDFKLTADIVDKLTPTEIIMLYYRIAQAVLLYATKATGRSYGADSLSSRDKAVITKGLEIFWSSIELISLDMLKARILPLYLKMVEKTGQDDKDSRQLKIDAVVNMYSIANLTDVSLLNIAEYIHQLPGYSSGDLEDSGVDIYPSGRGHNFSIGFYQDDIDKALSFLYDAANNDVSGKAKKLMSVLLKTFRVNGCGQVYSELSISEYLKLVKSLQPDNQSKEKVNV